MHTPSARARRQSRGEKRGGERNFCGRGDRQIFFKRDIAPWKNASIDILSANITHARIHASLEILKSHLNFLQIAINSGNE
jgi:hypothetical protein